MKRIIYDTPRWSLYLHRAARGLHRADPSDPPERRLEDELFERLFSGECEALAVHDRDPAYGDWATRIHDTCSQLPAFERLGQECRGRAEESAMAVETLMEQLRPDEPDAGLRRSARQACGSAAAAIEQLRDALEGLGGVAFAQAPGLGSGSDGVPAAGGRIRSLASRLRTDARLRRIAQLAGRFTRIAAAKRRSKVRHGADEIVDVEQGADLARLLPLELVQLVHPRTKLMAYRNLLERQCLQYRLEGTEALGRGPLVVAIDKSGSMEGERDVWATAVALALLDIARAERRPFALLCFDGRVKHEAVVMPGEGLPEGALFVPADGGTNIEAVVRRGLEIIEERPGPLRRADIVLITDGGSNADRAPELRARATALGVTVLGVAIDTDCELLMPWCDRVIAASDMSLISDSSAEVLFAGP